MRARGSQRDRQRCGPPDERPAQQHVDHRDRADVGDPAYRTRSARAAGTALPTASANVAQHDDRRRSRTGHAPAAPFSTWRSWSLPTLGRPGGHGDEGRPQDAHIFAVDDRDAPGPAPRVDAAARPGGRGGRQLGLPGGLYRDRERAMVAFGQLLRQLRTSAGLSQEELAQAAALSTRTVSDLERGINLTARNETARLLADALGLAGPDRAGFLAAAAGRDPGAGVAAASRALPRDIASFTGRAGELRPAGGRGRGGRHLGDRRDGRRRQDRVRGPRRPPARAALPRRADLPAAARAYRRAAAGAARRRAGHLAADHRDRARADPGQPGSRGPACGETGCPGSGCC